MAKKKAAPMTKDKPGTNGGLNVKTKAPMPKGNGKKKGKGC